MIWQDTSKIIVQSEMQHLDFSFESRVHDRKYCFVLSL